jgi:multiple sugar transport system permease protein
MAIHSEVQSAPAAPRRQARPAASRPAPSRRAGRWGGKALTYLVLGLVTLICAAPFVWMLSASLEPLGQIFSWPPHWIPAHPTLHNYTSFVNSGSDIERWFVNSAIIAGSVTILQTLLSALAAYAFAKRRFPGRDLIFYMFLGTMMFPGAILFIPNYIVLKHIPLFGGNNLLGQGGHGWLNSYWGLIVPAIVSPFSIFLLRQFMKSIPDDLLDAARMDGGSELWIFSRVVLPLSRPALAAVAIFTFGYFWQDFLWPLIVINSPNLYTLPLGLGLFVQQNKTVWDLLMAGSVISIAPVVVLFLIFQRQFVQGIALSGMKG